MNNSFSESRNEISFKRVYGPPSVKSYSAKNEEREKRDSLQNVINNIAYY